MKTWNLVLCFLAAVMMPDRIEGQVPSRPDSAVTADLEECRAAAAELGKARMEAAVARLEAAAQSMEATRPVEALVIHARIRSQCRIPFAGMMQKGTLVAESNALLERALAQDPKHLAARFTLAMNHYNSPLFMDRTGMAVQEMERVLRDHGALTEPVIATAYLHLGTLYERQGRKALALQTWKRGAEQFPSDARLREKAGGPSPPKEPPPKEPEPAQKAADVAPTEVTYALAPIVVSVGTYSVEDPRAATRMTKREVYTLPGGTADIFQTLQTLPGVTRVGDSGDLYVRGGDPAETPIYVDGARLFHPGRFETLNGSIFGVFDPSVMRTAYFSSGGFSARYGNALSGIVALETDRRPTSLRWRAGANIVSVGGSLWQPLGVSAGIWATGMLTNTQLLLELHDRTANYPESPTSRQFMVGAAFEPIYGIELRVGALDVSDQTTTLISATGYDGPYRSESGSRLGTAEFRAAHPNGRMLARLTLAASTRDTDVRFGVLERDHDDREFGARLDGELKRARVTLRAGLEGALIEAVTDGAVPAGQGIAPGSPVVHLDRDREETDHLGAYTEIEWRASRRIALLGGVRADRLPGENDNQVDPRLGAAYSAGGWTFRLAGGGFSQGRWRTRYALPNEGNPVGVPLRARHLVAGIQREDAPALRAEAYIKRYDSYVAENGVAASAPQVVAGRAAGLDVLVRPQAIGPVVAWLTYSYLDAKVELEDGSWVPSRYDVTHSVSAVGKLTVGEWELGLTSRYGTGRPYTPILGGTPPRDNRPPAPIYAPPNSQRLPTYFRLDGRLSRLVQMQGGIVNAYLEGLNLLDRGNVTSYTYDASYLNPRPVRTFFGDRTLVFGVEAQF